MAGLAVVIGGALVAPPAFSQPTVDEFLRQNPAAMKDAQEVIDALRGKHVQASPDGEGANGIDLGSMITTDAIDPQQIKEKKAVPPLLVFISSSMPPASVKAVTQDVVRAGGVAVLRGLVNDSMKDTASYLFSAFGEKAQNLGVIIDPRLFRVYGVNAAPTFIVAQKGAEPCDGKDCETPAYDKVVGDITLRKALEIVVRDGDAGRVVAAKGLASLGGAQ